MCIFAYGRLKKTGWDGRKKRRYCEQLTVSHGDNRYHLYCSEKYYEKYLAHALCTGGSCRFVFNGREFELHEGDLMIVRKGKLIERMEPSDDFRIK